MKKKFTADVEPHVIGLVERMEMDGWELSLDEDLKIIPTMWRATFSRHNLGPLHMGVSANQAVAICLAVLAAHRVPVGYLNRGEYTPSGMA